MPVQTKRLNINLPVALYDDLQSLATQTNRSMTEVMRTAFGLVKVAIRETDQGNTLVVANNQGKPIREIVIPR